MLSFHKHFHVPMLRINTGLQSFMPHASQILIQSKQRFRQALWLGLSSGMFCLTLIVEASPSARGSDPPAWWFHPENNSMWFLRVLYMWSCRLRWWKLSLLPRDKSQIILEEAYHNQEKFKAEWTFLSDPHQWMLAGFFLTYHVIQRQEACNKLDMGIPNAVIVRIRKGMNLSKALPNKGAFSEPDNFVQLFNHCRVVHHACFASFTAQKDEILQPALSNLARRKK